ncbi:hypothetical protein HII31_09423 [Pseudocercospora fuligena]|uniref:F-box domain-containing protein n=1 Tax=Pseudocercospora fuligena TaxID=685502 RepID=A0A8H6RCE0_9PEZI|nr:hypothetical protein HII31_09423 [Pseudocercospora fuligena]
MLDVASHDDLIAFRARVNEKLERHRDCVVIKRELEEMLEIGMRDYRLVAHWVIPRVHTTLHGMEIAAYRRIAITRGWIREGSWKPHISDLAVASLAAKAKDKGKGSAPRPVKQSTFKTQASRLLSLPAELRNNIYRNALISKSRIAIRDAAGDVFDPPALLSVCRQISEEAASIFWAENSFCLSLCYADWQATLHTLEVMAGQHLQKIPAIECEWVPDDVQDKYVEELAGVNGTPFKVIVDDWDHVGHLHLGTLYNELMYLSRELLCALIAKGVKVEHVTGVREAAFEDTVSADEVGIKAILARQWRTLFYFLKFLYSTQQLAKTRHQHLRTCQWPHEMANTITQRRLAYFQGFIRFYQECMREEGKTSVASNMEEVLVMGQNDVRVVDVFIKYVHQHTNLDSMEKWAFMMVASARRHLRKGSKADDAKAISEDAAEVVISENANRSHAAEHVFRFKTQDSPLLKLPGELRNDIYRLAVVEEPHIRIRHINKSLLLRTPALLRVCKQMRGEVSSIFWAETSISIEICGDDWKDSLKSLGTIAAGGLKDIKFIEVDYKLEDAEEDELQALLRGTGPFVAPYLGHPRCKLSGIYVSQMERSRELLLDLLKRGVSIESITAAQGPSINSGIKDDEPGIRALIARNWGLTFERERQTFLDAIKELDISRKERSAHPLREAELAATELEDK